MARRSSRARPTADLSYITPALRPLAVPISTLVHDPHNARSHPEENSEAVEGSLRRFGQRQVVTFNPTLGNRVITGNERLRIARDVLGWTHIAAVAVEEDERSSVGYALADNRTAELAGWDERALGQAMQLCDPGMNEQLDRMVRELGAQMAVSMPDMAAQLPASEPTGRPSHRTPDTATVPNPDEIPMDSPDRGGVAQQRILKLGSNEIPMTPDEERALLERLATYQRSYGTTFGFVASLLENACAENGAAEVSAPRPIQPEAHHPGSPDAAAG